MHDKKQELKNNKSSTETTDTKQRKIHANIQHTF